MKELEELGYTIDEVLSMSIHSSNFQELCYLITKKYGNDIEILNKIALFMNISVKDIEKAAYQYKNKTTNQEDKIIIINELKEANVPITLYTFELAINKYNNGHLKLITKDNVDSYLERVKKR